LQGNNFAVYPGCLAGEALDTRNLAWFVTKTHVSSPYTDLHRMLRCLPPAVNILRC